MKHSFDEEMMKKAIELGDSSRALAPPNPWVGCVIAKNDTIIGQGATQKVGGAHAEIVALQEAGSAAEGATLYVTLEPCCHHGRTPPCIAAIIQHCLKRVVIALQDPDPRVNGQGIEQLKKAGIEVVLGIEQTKASYSLEPYLFQRSNKRPFVLAKCACSIDGRLAAKDSSSKWISSEAARRDAHELRSQSQAILIGSGTASKDLPRLTVANARPLRVVLDSKGTLEPTGPLFDTSLAPTLIFTTKDSPMIDSWKKFGAHVEIVSKSSCGVNLREVLQVLYSKDILQVLCEGGGILLGSLFKEGLVNRLTTYVSPCLLGDQGKPMLEHFDIASIQEAIRPKFLNSKELDGTMRIDYSI